MDTRFIIEGFTRDYENEICKFESKVEQFEEFLEGVDFFTYVCKYARDVKINILEFHNAELMRAYHLGYCDTRLVLNLNKALKRAFDIIDTDMLHANDYWDFTHFIFKKNGESLSGKTSADIVKEKHKRIM